MLAKTELATLPESERNILTLAGARLLFAAAQQHVYEAVTAVFSCAGQSFTANGKTVLAAGWKELERRYRATLKGKGYTAALCLVGIVLVAVYEVDRAENNVVMDMPLSMCVVGLSMNFEAVTARYVDVRLERKKEVLDAYYGAVKQADPAKAKEAEPKKAKSAAKKKSSEMEL